jgi:hypothetical protein
VAFSPDGSRIVSGCSDNTVKLWDCVKGHEVLTLVGHTQGVTSACFSADGRRIASGSWDGTLKVWEAVTTQDVFTLGGHHNFVHGVTFNPAGSQIVSWDRMGRVLAWDARTGRLVPDPGVRMPEGPRAMQMSDGRSLHTQALNVVLIDLERQKRAAEFARKRLAEWARFDPGWHRSELVDALQSGNAFAASFHGERLLREYPFDAKLHTQQAHALARLGQATEATTHLMHALFLNPHAHLGGID